MIKKHISDNIPEFFNSYDTGEPFEHCLNCGKKLINESKYFIEKVLKQNKNMASPEIIYEYAICFSCTQEVQGELSEESLRNIQALFEEHSFNALMNLEYLHSTEKYDIHAWLERCSITGKETRLCSEYSVSCIIEDGKLVYEHSPMVISDDFMELIQESLSAKTREYLDGFRDSHFDLPPDIKDIINTPTIGIF